MADPTVIINLEPDWGYTPEISYAFETVIQPTPYFVEQRRPLLPTPIRTQGCRYAFSGNSLQYARNLFLYGLSKLCCVPIYSEPIFSAAVTQGATSITATTDLTYLWNLKNSDWIVLLDFVSGQSEMLGISSVSGQVINLSSAIVNSWTASRTIIFPAFAGTISKVKGMDTTDRVGRVDVEFEEQPIGEVSTKVWVGLNEQICENQFFWDGIWTELFPIDNNNYQWGCISNSKFGEYILVGRVLGPLYVSSNRGFSWLSNGPSLNWYSSAINGSGQYMIAGSYTRLYVSSNYGVGWSEVRPAGNADKWWRNVAISESGAVMYAIVPGGRAYKSSNYGSSWSEIQPLGATNQPWYGCSCSGTGQVVVIPLSTTSVYISLDGGISWTERRPTGGSTGADWEVSFCNASGSVICAAMNGGGAYVSTDYGNSWNLRKASASYRGGACNGAGNVIVLSTPTSNLSISEDHGETWVTVEPKPLATLGSVAVDFLGRSLVVCSQRSFTGRVYSYFV